MYFFQVCEWKKKGSWLPKLTQTCNTVATTQRSCCSWGQILPGVKGFEHPSTVVLVPQVAP